MLWALEAQVFHEISIFGRSLQQTFIESMSAWLNQFKLGSIKVELLRSFSRLERNFRLKD